MIDLSKIPHHPAVEEMVDVICNKTQNTDRNFFRCEAVYFLAKMASSMRAVISTKDRGDIPVSCYALALASSGFGKGHSVGIVENEFLQQFKKRFLEDTMLVIAEQNLWKIANERAIRNNTDPQVEFDKVEKEFKRAGAFAFTFDSGTAPAVKQFRHKLILASIGAISLQVDEIGSNLTGNTEILTLFLELFDQGLVKQKLTKNTAENERSEEIDGKTPTNMLLFGTPSSLLDGGQVEDLFYSFLETGYGRRCLFGFGQQDRKAFHTQDASEIYRRLTQSTNGQTTHKWADHFYNLADPAMFGWKMDVEEDVGIEIQQYKIDCEKAAELMPAHDEVRKAEISHRYFKALKVAGALAFVDQSALILMEHLHAAIKLVEESGEAFQKILTREKAHVKLAKYIADVGVELTHAELTDALPFYPASSQGRRTEMMNLAIAWGYREHIIIKKTFTDGIDFFKGEKLQETDIEKLSLSYSPHYAYHYESQVGSFEELRNLVQYRDPDTNDVMHWCNHGFLKHHRAEENVIPGFNMIVLDVDGTCPINVCHELLKDIKFMTYTTKRHTEDENRYRVVIPINYRLELDSEEYKQFMNAVMQWLPFETDESANQRAKKWETNDGEVFYNMEGELFDVLRFIPKTTKNELYQKEFQKLESLDNLERWFAQLMVTGNRNNNLLKFALALVDGGLDLQTVDSAVHSFNKKLSNPLDKDEIDMTIMRTVAKRYAP